MAEPSARDIEATNILLSLQYSITQRPQPTTPLPPRPPVMARLPPRPPKMPRSEAHLPPRPPPRPNSTLRAPLRVSSMAGIAPRDPQRAQSPPRLSADLAWSAKRRRTHHYRPSVERKEAERVRCESPSTPLDYAPTSGSGTSASGSAASPPSESSSAAEVGGWVPSAARRPRSQTGGAKGKSPAQDVEPMRLDYGVGTEEQEKTAKRLKKSVRAEVPDLNYPPPSRP